MQRARRGLTQRFATTPRRRTTSRENFVNKNRTFK